ncbi:MAG: hypothetical protein LBN39_12745 [Planctomycetaceae bacterium]|jgi:Mrp family chromosome partitioning ATPase|nr:hypothetical protein [Planctomycetaceae bacterium]
MSATSEILKPHGEAGVFPAALRSAAYISTGGRVYRLFSETEQTALDTEPFHLDKETLPMFPPKEEDENAQQVPPLPSSAVQLTEDFDSLCVLGGNPHSALKLFEAFSEHSPSRLKKKIVCNTAPAAAEKIREEAPAVLSLTDIRNFSVVPQENGISSAVKTSVSLIRLEVRQPLRFTKRPFSPKSALQTTPVIAEPPKTDDISASHATPLTAAAPVRFPAYLEQLKQDAREQVQVLADTLEEQCRQGRKTLSFNSIRLGDGCTTLCLCAARELAQRGYHVLLADAHKQHPELPELLGLTVDQNLYEIFTLIPNRLELLPWSETFLEFDEHNNGSARSFSDVITSLRKDYDIILLDNGCLTQSSLADPVAQWKAMHCDGLLLVLNTRHPAPFDVKSIVRKLSLQEVEFIGIAENYV